MRNVGVEEELLLLDAESGRPRALSSAILQSARHDSAATAEVFKAELQLQQLEFATHPQTQMRDLATEIIRWRAASARYARLILTQKALARLLQIGNGAQIQRELLAEGVGSLREMVAVCVRRTQGR
ncbi:glutamate-cysteine ligase family protein [Actinacidiphila glaucinigra]|uniref:glutamate-cysteine ligase family protein n=1 Tax=Actinacidiphila glaucinigra TaxID=235986 RepID=UPI0033A3EB77